ncbi:MAG: glucose-6-phosphate isomerase, partial [Patescibacteria group bacterium]
NNRPNITISINSLTEETLGELLMLFMCETAFLGEFFGINAFDQPGVELSKKLIDRNFAKQNTLSTKI